MKALQDIKKAKQNLLLIRDGKDGEKLTPEKTAIALEIATLCCSMAEVSLNELKGKIKNLI